MNTIKLAVAAVALTALAACGTNREVKAPAPQQEVTTPEKAEDTWTPGGIGFGLKLNGSGFGIGLEVLPGFVL